ncbi:MAG: hypothetical protein QOE89_2813, partial [Pseudonocardiales bacterium]|nr:hypothetical protein [Pseudonocardiales bacterium]
MTDTDTDTTLPTNQTAPDDEVAHGVGGRPTTEGRGQQSADEPAADTETDELESGSEDDGDADGGDADDGDADGGDAEDGDGKRGGSLLVREGDIAADYLERLLDIVDYDGDI